MFFASVARCFEEAMDANKSLPNAKYIQVATTGANASMDDQNDESGFPAIRTVVFRGFLDRDPTKVTFVTDKRSKKVGDFAVNNKCEIAGIFQKQRAVPTAWICQRHHE